MKAAVLLSPRLYQVVRWGPTPDNFLQMSKKSNFQAVGHLGEVEPVRSGVGGGEVGEPRRKKHRQGCKEEEKGRNLRQNNLLKRKQELKG